MRSFIRVPPVAGDGANYFVNTWIVFAMRFLSIVFTVLWIVSTPVFGQDASSIFQPAAADSLASEQYLLFDSETFMGWRVQNDGPYGGGHFTIEDGTICSDPAHPGLILTTGQFSDISLSFEMEVDKETDAFLLLRTSPSPKNLRTSCYAMVLSSSSAHPDRNVCSALGRRMASYKPTDKDLKPNPDGSLPWRRFDVYASGKEVRITSGAFLNNECYDHQTVRRGYIGFLVTRGKARFRNITWSLAQSQPLFDPNEPDLPAWTRLEEEKGFEAEVDFPELVVRGPGTIESKKEYDNFILRADFKSVGSATSADLFFRYPPGSPGRTGGYGCPLAGGVRESGAAPVLGERTGGLLFLCDARNVGFENDVWSTLLVKAVDDHIQIWVNGIQTLDYFDRRASEGQTDPFPPKSGTFLIHSRSLGSCVKFRNIEVSTIPKRWITSDEDYAIREERNKALRPPQPTADQLKMQ